jgi:mannose-6-phosphate isomerase-like protein (cupin superfamily)
LAEAARDVRVVEVMRRDSFRSALIDHLDSAVEAAAWTAASRAAPNFLSSGHSAKAKAGPPRRSYAVAIAALNTRDCQPAKDATHENQPHASIPTMRGSWPMTTEPVTRAQSLWFIDTLVYIHVDGEQSGGAYSLSETWGARGNMPPLHVHRRNDETFYVLEGDVRLFLGDREIMLAPGQAALAPRGVPHT